MSVAENLDAGAAGDLEAALAAQQAAFRQNPNPSWQERRDNLRTLRKVILDNQERIIEAVNADFGHRSRHETLAAEIFVTDSGIKYLLDHAKRWMRPQKRHVAITFAPAKGVVHVQPKGVIGVISPWNYPLQLALVPVATALAAGNRVMLKPSELTPHTSALMAEMLHSVFPTDLVQVHTGGVDVGVAFSKLAFDHLLYTGSTHVGRLVMQAAASNLTPVTLELGGKSPALIHEDCPLDGAVERIVYGKLLNAGQTCVAPDYALVPRSRVDAFVAKFQELAKKSYPSLKDNPDYTAIINDRHRARLQHNLDDAAAKGARLVEVNPASEDLSDSPKMVPTLVLDGTDDMQILQDEIFGPLLPVIPYDTLDEAIAYINERPRPLALYYFDHHGGRIERVLEQTHSGGVCVNETMMHVAMDDMPFGGIGPSGLGAYHGEEGFFAFSHKKSVLYQRRIRFTGLFNPPYGPTIDRLLSLLIG